MQATFLEFFNLFTNAIDVNEYQKLKSSNTLNLLLSVHVYNIVDGFKLIDQIIYV